MHTDQYLHEARTVCAMLAVEYVAPYTSHNQRNCGVLK